MDKLSTCQVDFQAPFRAIRRRNGIHPRIRTPTATRMSCIGAGTTIGDSPLSAFNRDYRRRSKIVADPSSNHESPPQEPLLARSGSPGRLRDAPVGKLS